MMTNWECSHYFQFIPFGLQVPPLKLKDCCWLKLGLWLFLFRLCPFHQSVSASFLSWMAHSASVCLLFSNNSGPQWPIIYLLEWLGLETTNDCFSLKEYKVCVDWLCCTNHAPRRSLYERVYPVSRLSVSVLPRLSLIPSENRNIRDSHWAPVSLPWLADEGW